MHDIMKKKFLVLLIIVAILGSIGVYLWTNDMIYGVFYKLSC